MGFDSPHVHHVNGPIVQWQNTRLADEGWRFDSARVHQVSKGSSETHKRPRRSGVGFRNGNFWTAGLPTLMTPTMQGSCIAQPNFMHIR